MESIHIYVTDDEDSHESSVSGNAVSQLIIDLLLREDDNIKNDDVVVATADDAATNFSTTIIDHIRKSRDMNSSAYTLNSGGCVKR
jgi:hypothetical protein